MRQAPRGSILGPPRARFRAVFVDHGGNGFFLGSLRGDHELTGWKARPAHLMGHGRLGNCAILCAECQKPQQPVRVR